MGLISQMYHFYNYNIKYLNGYVKVKNANQKSLCSPYILELRCICHQFHEEPETLADQLLVI